MDFRKATDELFDRTGHSALAEALGVSVATIRQARLSPKAKAFRAPPDGWEAATAKLAKLKIDQLQRLVKEVQK